MNSKLKLTAIIGFLFGLALCFSLPAHAGSPADACSLLTSAQVSGVLGMAVGAGKPAGPRDCQWFQPDAGLRGKSVLLEILGPMGNLTPVDRFNTVKTPLPVKGIRKEPVSGIGDDAVYVTSGAFSTALYVKKGGSVFQIRISGFPAEETRAKEKALAQDVLARF